MLLLRHQPIEQFLTGIDAELLVDVAGVGLRGARGDDEFVGHAGKRLALSKQLHHLPFAWREAARFGHGGAATRQTRALVLLGWSLAHARERKVLDVSTAARKRVIRPDIRRAIEEGDFARRPPRGYTSNMVGAYARLVGLNPTEVTRAYREEVYQFETGRRPASNRRERPRDAGRTVALPSSRDRGSSRGPYRDDYAGSPRSGRSGLRGSSARTGRAAPPPQ